MEEKDIIYRLIWLNFTVSWYTLTTGVIILLCILLPHWIWQSISVLLIGLFSCIVWYKWDKEIRGLL